MDAAAVANGVRRRHLLVVGCLAASGLVLFWTRSVPLDASLWHDEAVTVRSYVAGGPQAIFFDHYIPNIHPLFSLLAWATTELLGRTEAVLRAWSVVPAWTAVLVAAWWAWRRLSPEVAALVVLLGAASPLHQSLAVQARGYGLGMLAGAGALVAALEMRGDRPGVAATGFGVAAFAGVATLPVFALAVIGHAVLLLADPRTRRSVLVVVPVVGAASSAVYAPMITDVIDSSNQRFGEQVAPSGILTRPYDDLVEPLLRTLVPARYESVTDLLFVSAAFVLLVVSFMWCRVRGQLVLFSHLFVPVLLTYAALSAGRFYVTTRFVSFLLVNVLLLAAIGLGGLLALIRRVPHGRAFAALALLALVTVGLRNAIAAGQEAAALPLEDAKLVGQVVRGSGVDLVLSNTDRPPVLEHYLPGLLVAGPEGLETLFCEVTVPFAYVDHDNGTSPDPDTACLDGRVAARVRVEQRTRGSFVVWLVAGRAQTDR